MIYAQDVEWAKIIAIRECTTDETTEIFETCCLEIEVTVDSKGPPGMALAIRELLRAARSQTEPSFDNITQHGIQRLARHQWELGSRAIQWGIFHHDWADKVTTEWNDGRRRCAHKWMASISNRIWELNKEHWEHRNDVLHKNDNAVRKAENARLDIDIANIDTTTILAGHRQTFFSSKGRGSKFKRRSSRKRGNGFDRQQPFYETI
jgi:hypothetical protein